MTKQKLELTCGDRCRGSPRSRSLPVGSTKFGQARRACPYGLPLRQIQASGAHQLMGAEGVG
jgi:hypothetical protein